MGGSYTKLAGFVNVEDGSLRAVSIMTLAPEYRVTLKYTLKSIPLYVRVRGDEKVAKKTPSSCTHPCPLQGRGYTK
jgi:hypothetical protein